MCKGTKDTRTLTHRAQGKSLQWPHSFFRFENFRSIVSITIAITVQLFWHTLAYLLLHEEKYFLDLLWLYYLNCFKFFASDNVDRKNFINIGSDIFQVHLQFYIVKFLTGSPSSNVSCVNHSKTFIKRICNNQTY